MTTTRSTDKISETGDQAAGTKHEVEEKPAPTPKRSKKGDDKEQKTIEETMQSGVEPPKEESEETGVKPEDGSADDDDEGDRRAAAADGGNGSGSGSGSKDQEKTRRRPVTSNVLEKGLIYFFLRGRVGIDEPGSVGDIRRSYMVLRPLEDEAAVLPTTPRGGGGGGGDGVKKDADADADAEAAMARRTDAATDKARLLAVPKKTFPTSGRDRWLALVEAEGQSLEQLRKGFLSGEDYETKTAGTRHTPGVEPVAEGVYAVVTTGEGRESHLAYVLTLPDPAAASADGKGGVGGDDDVGEIQFEMGLRRQGSFVLSTRNPKYGGSGNVPLPPPAEYPEEIQDSFRALRWMPTIPQHLDYTNSQVLLIGEANHVKEVTEQAPKDPDGEEKNKPAEELEELEHEDTLRMKALGEDGDGSKAVFADLRARAEEYPGLRTKFGESSG